MFWDGERWLPDEPLPAKASPRQPRRRHRDWLATGVMIVALVGLMVPLMAVSAATNSGRTLISNWSQSHDIKVQQESSSRLDYQGEWFTAYYSDYLAGKVRSTDRAGASVRLKFKGAAVSWIGPTGPTRGSAKVFIDGKLRRHGRPPHDGLPTHACPVQARLEQAR